MDSVRIRPGPGVLLLLWCAVVWALSDRPDPTGTGSLPLDLPDWVWHFIEFAPGGVLAALTLCVGDTLEDALPALGFCAGYALLDEWHQSFVPGRDPSGTDVAADVVGAAAGVLFATVLRRARTERALVPESGRRTADDNR